MNISSVTAVYYSATGNTQRVTESIAQKISEEWNTPFHVFDFSYPKNRAPQSYGPNDLVVFGTPAYAGRIPNKILPFIQTLFQGNGALAVPVVTFGNRSFDNALIELREELEQHGFHTIAAGAFPAQHAFSDKLAKGRPDDGDMEIIARFADDIAGKVRTLTHIPEPVFVPGTEPIAGYYTPLGIDGKPAAFLKAKPKTRETCTDCKACVAVCPMGSIDFDNPALVPGVCIKCHACVKACPLQSKYFDDPAFLSHVAMLEQTYGERAKVEVFL